MLSAWQMFGLASVRTKKCSSCGATIGASGFSILVGAVLGTWFPVACGFLGLGLGAGRSGYLMLVGGLAGLALGASLFMWLYHLCAKLVVRNA
jgi:hypothetical protein